MPNEHNFRKYAERASEARGRPLTRVSYRFSRHIPGGRESWFAAFGLPGFEFGWRYEIEVLPVRSSEQYWVEQVDSYSLTLAGAFSEALGKLPPEIHPWTAHILDMDLHGPWGVTSDFHTALGLEDLHGSDWLAEKILSAELLTRRKENSE